ncbi:MAG: hypothetical protein AAGK09_03285 [Planctomycetota bacterium]
MPKCLASHHSLRPAPAAQRRRNRGSVLLLVVVSIVLMTIMGATYLQVARVDRFSMEQVEFESGDIDAVVSASLVAVEAALRDDVLEIDGGGNAYFLSRSSRDSDLLGDESYDYPWTNTTTPGDGDDMWLASTTPRFADDDPSGAYGTAINPEWPQLTNLLDPLTMGTGDAQFLRLPRSITDPDYPNPSALPQSPSLYGGSAAGIVALIVDADILNGAVGGSLSEFATDTTWERLGADADGDGVPDARWTYAPVRRVGTTEYVMAIRIVDNSAMLNLNAATFLTNGGAAATAFDGATTFAAARRPRGYFASDFDFARLASRVVDNSGSSTFLPVITVANELDSWMTGTRMLTKANVDGEDMYVLGLDTVSSTTNPLLDPDRLPAGISASPLFFNEFGRMSGYLEPSRGTLDYGSATGKYAEAATEIDLRYGNGVNETPGTEATAVELNMPELLRDTGNTYPADDDQTLTALQYRAAEIARDGITGPLSDEDALAYYFQGGPETNTYASREFPAIRQMLTTYNGVDTLIPNNDGLSHTAPNTSDTKFSLLTGEYDWSGGAYDASAREQDLFDIIYGILELTNDGGTSAYLGLTSTADIEAISARLLAAFLDSTDADNTPQSPNLSGITERYFGMERLPILREVFAVVAYDHVDRWDLDDNDNPGVDGFFDEWQVIPDSEGLAVEIGNPFDREITFGGADDARVRIRTSQTAGTDVWVYELTNTENLDPALDTDFASIGTEQPADQHVIYVDPAETVNAGEGETEITDMATNFGVPAGVDRTGDASVSAGDSEPFVYDDGPVLVELQVEIDGNWVTYDRMEITDANFPAELKNPAQVNFNLAGGAADAALVLPTSADQMDSHAQVSVARDGRGIRYITNFTSASAPNNLEPTVDAVNAERSGNTPISQFNGSGGVTITELGFDNKSLGATPIDASANAAIASNFDQRFPLSVPDHAVLSVSDLASIPMLGFVTDAAITTTQDTLVDVITDVLDDPDAFVGLAANTLDAGGTLPTGYEDWQRAVFLDISPDAAIVDLDTTVGGDQGMPHAALLFDRLTVIDPATDDRNNDPNNDPDTDETPTQPADIEERLVPGLMNINTVPGLLAAMSAPLPEALDDAEALFRAIAAYRDYPDTRAGNGYPVGLPTATIGLSGYRPGIASIGELIFINDTTSLTGLAPGSVNVGTPGSDENLAMQTIGRDGLGMNIEAANSADDRYDIVPMVEVQDFAELPAGSGGLGQTVERRTMIDGAKERLARFQFLSNLFTTRSDVFTAYVVIRGYQAGAYEQGATEQARYIAVFDRSGLRDAGTPLRLIAYERVD